MLVTKYFQVFHLTIPSSWLAVLIAFLLAYIASRMMYGKLIAHAIVDIAFYFIIFWKLSFIVTDFKAALQFPLSILYFNGGTIGVYIGMIAAGVYVFRIWQKGQIQTELFYPLFIGSILILSTYQICMALFNDGTLTSRLLTIGLFSGLCILVIIWKEKLQEVEKELAFLLIGVHGFVGALQDGGIFQTTTVGAVLVAMLFLGMKKLGEKDLEAIH